MSLTVTKDDIVKALARENGCQLNQSVELVESSKTTTRFSKL